MNPDLTWFAVNNTATANDAPALAPFGVDLRAPSSDPVTVRRDPITGRLLAQIGTVQVLRDGAVLVCPRHDCPPVGTDVLVSTALECVERDLHKRDGWGYRRATSKRHGYWHAVICMSIPDGSPLFTAHAAALAAAPVRGLDLTSSPASTLHAEAVTR